MAGRGNGGHRAGTASCDSRRGSGTVSRSMPGGRSDASTRPSRTSTVSRAPASGSPDTCNAPKSSGSAGAIRRMRSGTDGSNRSSVRSRWIGVAAAQACGEQEVGYVTGVGYASRSNPQNSSGRSAAEVGCCRQQPEPDTLGRPDETVPHQPGGTDGAVVWPHRPVVVTHRVVGGHRGAEGADSEAGEHLRSHEPIRDCGRLVVADDAGPQAVTHVRCE